MKEQISLEARVFIDAVNTNIVYVGMVNECTLKK
jgi:hypothetical protein